jgi:alpha-tubulin suppressor-like RCC1 family protein
MSRATCHSRFVPIAVALLSAGCDRSLAPPPIPTKLAFLGQPSTSELGHSITPVVQVAIQDASGATLDGAIGSVTVAIGTNPGGGTLSGTTTVTPVHGIAVFADLRIDRIGTGFTLAATSPSLTGAASAAFDIRPLSVARVSVSAGGDNTCGVTMGGAAYCWGYNNVGQLGDGATTDTTRPAAVGGGLSFAGVGADAAGNHRCGVTTAGAAYCWGSNGYGALGNGTTTNQASPAAVAGGLTFAAVSSGGGTDACGVTTAGAAYCWGINTGGQLGIGTTTGSEVCGNNPCSTTPVAVVGGLTFIAVSTGTSHTCGITAAGSAYCWGANRNGQLGNGTMTGPQECNGFPCSLSPIPVAGGLTFAAVSAGTGYTCGVTMAGAAYCWGYNGTGQLGDGTATERRSPVAVLGGLRFVTVSTAGDPSGSGHTCGLTITGGAYCWGFNLYGELGDGTNTTRSSPGAVSGGLTFTALAVGSNESVSGHAHTCGVTTAGAAYCWGSNGNGQLGVGTTTGPQLCSGSPCSTTPLAVVGGLGFAP